MLIDFLDYLVIHGDGMGKGQVMIFDSGGAARIEEYDFN